MEALVVQASSNRAVVRRQDGSLHTLAFPRRLERPLAGDRVILDRSGNLSAIEPRRNLFGRGDPRGHFRPAAANLDRAAIVIAAEPSPSPDLLHRYLTAALIHGIEPLIVINKCDLTRPDSQAFCELEDLRQLGYAIIQTRCRPEPALGELAERLSSGTTLLAGQSGVGKTSLLNALIPDLDAQTGALSRVTGKGTHTTTSATLHLLPSGARLIDTPGVWEYGLWSMPATELVRGFPEFVALPLACRFRDCRHQGEPGCAVRQAVDEGRIPASRLGAWLRLLGEQARLGG